MVTHYPKKSTLEPEVYSLAEFAALFGLSYTTAHLGAQGGTLPVTPIRLGRKYLFPRSAVHALLGIDNHNDDHGDQAA